MSQSTTRKFRHGLEIEPRAEPLKLDIGGARQRRLIGAPVLAPGRKNRKFSQP